MIPLWDVALQSLKHRPLRSTLTVLGVALAGHLYVTMAGTMAAYEEDLAEQYRDLAGRIVVQQPLARPDENEGFPSFSSGMPSGVAEAVLASPGIDRQASSAVLFLPLARPALPDGPPAVLLVGIEPGHEAAFIGNVTARDGEAAFRSMEGVILGEAAAAYYAEQSGSTSLDPGQTVQVVGEDFTVDGLLRSSSWLLDGAVLMPLATVQELFSLPDTVSGVMLAVAPEADAADVQRNLAARFPSLQTQGPGELVESVSRIINNERLFFRGINTMVLSGVAIVLAVVMMGAVAEQRREIATLRALGATRGNIAGLVAVQVVVLILAGMVIAWPLWGLASLTLLRDFLVTADLAFAKWLEVLLLGIVVAALAAIAPTLRAVRVDPTEILRDE